MTARGFYTLLFGLLMLVTSLSVGSAALFLLGVAALSALSLSLLGVLLAFMSLRMQQSLDVDQVSRMETCVYSLRVRQFSVLPVAPLSLRIRMPSGRQSEFLLPTKLFGENVSANPFPCPHVGIAKVGLCDRITVRDCFAFFALRRRVKTPPLLLTVLPNPADAELPAFSPGEGESSITQRALADRTTPVDTRLWQEGDELKRVHWKLSMRRQMLMVHTYEMPQRSDALILLDCAQPEAPYSRWNAMIDVLTEECAGVLKVLLESAHPVRMPLCGKHSREVAGQDANALPAMLEALAQEPFDAVVDFSRVLMLSARRLRRTGATVILTSHLTPVIADTVIALSRMGPKITLTLVTAGEKSREQTQLLALLMRSGISVRHVQA